jgi:glutamate synthase (NADPH/NADH) small chain
MAAADRLRSAGYAVTIYDRHDRAGGLLMYGIPGFKLEKPVVQRRLDRLAEGGVTFRLGVDVGGDLPFAEVRAAHDAVLVATGVYQARRLEPQGAGRCRPGLRQRRSGRSRQAGGGDRRRRYGDGLCTHGGAAGRQVRDLPVSPRP